MPRGSSPDVLPRTRRRRQAGQQQVACHAAATAGGIVEHTDNDDLSAELERRNESARQWLINWLESRDHFLDQIKIDDIAAALEAVAAELRLEAKQRSPASAGLALAADVLDDSAEGVRVGDALPGG
jgi:hypothetical protein